MADDTRQDANKDFADPPEDKSLILPLVAHQFQSTRLAILSAYWLVVLICLPIWWTMTSIERLSLPNERIALQDASLSKLRFQIYLHVDSSALNQNSRGEIAAAQKQLGLCISENEQAWRGIAVDFVSTPPNAPSGDLYLIKLKSSRETRKHEVSGRTLTYHATNDHYGTDLGATLCQLLAPSSKLVNDNRVVQYSPRFRLSFSLLNEDITDGGPRGWAVEKNINAILLPTLHQLRAIHNFTIESQVQYHAPLAFEPPQRFDVDGAYYTLGEDELKIFVNSAEWTLASSTTNDHVLHFILFSPALKHKPLFIRDTNGEVLSTPAFIIPQWGGVVLLNMGHKFSPSTGAEMFSLFRIQLLSLLGVPPLPTNIIHIPSAEEENGPLSAWQLDILTRKRTVENAENSVKTLSSIVKLVDKLENMPVGRNVRDDVVQALEDLEKIYQSFSAKELLRRATSAFSLSSRAFFNHDMVGLLYFPAEHKYAIYMLFAPASMPLIVSLIREIKDWRKARKGSKDRNA